MYLFLCYSVYNFIDYARSSSMCGQLVMHQCLHHVYIYIYIYIYMMYFTSCIYIYIFTSCIYIYIFTSCIYIYIYIHDVNIDASQADRALNWTARNQ